MKLNKKLALLLMTGMLAMENGMVVKAQDEVNTIEYTDSLKDLTKKQQQLVEFIEESSNDSIIEKEWLIPYGTLLLHCKNQLSDDVYSAINSLIEESSINSLAFVDTNLNNIDFSKLLCSNIENLAINSCTNNFNLENVKSWKSLHYLEICRTNFTNLDKLDHLEEFKISTSKSSYPKRENDFEFKRPFNKVLKDIEKGNLGLKHLIVQGIPVSNIKVPLENLTIFYTDESQIPDVLTFNASNISLNGPSHSTKTKRYKAPILNSDNCSRASLFYFDTALENTSVSCITDLDFVFCNINNPIDEVISSNAILNSTALNDGVKYSTYTEYNDNSNKYETVYINDDTNKEVGRTNSDTAFKVKSYKFDNNIKLF